jgi:hypothetical protein
LLATAERHAAIHCKAAQPGNGAHLPEAFADMSVLFLEAFEEVRVVSEQLREASQATRSQSRTLQAYCAQLLEQSAIGMKQLAKFMPPPPGDIRQAESEMVDIFRNGKRREKQDGLRIPRESCH